MTFEERKKQIQKHRNLANRSQEQIDMHPFVQAKKKLISKHNVIVQQLLSECTHEEVERRSEYYGGSYYDKAHTEYWNVCVLCGATSERSTEIHSWYG